MISASCGHRPDSAPPLDPRHQPWQKASCGLSHNVPVVRRPDQDSGDDIIGDWELPVARACPRKFSLLVFHNSSGAGMWDFRKEARELEILSAKLVLILHTPVSSPLGPATDRFDEIGRDGVKGLGGPRGLCRGENTGLYSVSIEARRERMRVGDVLADLHPVYDVGDRDGV